MSNKFKERLLNVARAVREAPDPSRFSQGSFGHKCGTPSCALGHYAVRKDMQRTFGLTFWGGKLTAYGDEVGTDRDSVTSHFGITSGESYDLFGKHGCDDAQTNIEAAEFIEAFAAKKWPSQASDSGVGNE